MIRLYTIDSSDRTRVWECDVAEVDGIWGVQSRDGIEGGKIKDWTFKEAKEKKVSQKARSLKEMFVKGGIEENDLKTKIKKVRQFLLVGHTVKIVVIAKKDILRRNPHAIDETTLKIIEKVEDYVKTVKQGRVGSAFRSDFILNPKTGEEIKKLQEDVAKQQKGELGDEELAA